MTGAVWTKLSIQIFSCLLSSNVSSRYVTIPEIKQESSTPLVLGREMASGCLLLLWMTCQCVCLASELKYVEHPVLFKMPGLATDIESETLILHNLNSLRIIPNVTLLLTGRLLEPVNGYTHGLFARFPSRQALKYYYSSDFFQVMIEPMLPFLKGEDAVDYNGYINNTHSDMSFGNEVVHVCLFKIKADIGADKVESLLTEVNHLHQALPSVVLEVTSGANVAVRSDYLVFSHAFVIRLSSEQVGDFYGSPAYKKVIRQIKKHSTMHIEADILPTMTPNLYSF